MIVVFILEVIFYFCGIDNEILLLYEDVFIDMIRVAYQLVLFNEFLLFLFL